MRRTLSRKSPDVTFENVDFLKVQTDALLATSIYSFYLGTVWNLQIDPKEQEIHKLFWIDGQTKKFYCIVLLENFMLQRINKFH